MSLFDKLKKASSGSAAQSGGASDFYSMRVRCRRCGEILSAQINLKNDLSQDYDSNTYFVRKVVMGSGQNRCFERVEIQLTFDSDRRLVDRQVFGGAFVDAGEDAKTEATA